MRHMNRILYILAILILPVTAFSQRDKESKKTDVSKRIMKSLESREPEETFVSDYLELADKLYKEGDNEKAEYYLIRAKEIIQKKKEKEQIAVIDRKLAKILEAKKEYEEAISAYLSAAKLTSDKTFRELNSNDAERLRNIESPALQANSIQKNIDLLEGRNSTERVVAFKQMAVVNKEMDNTPAAINSLENAIKEAENFPEETMLLEQEIAEIYKSDNQSEKAIPINQKLVEQAKQTNNSKLEIEQLVNLSSNYLQVGESKSAQETLEEAYKLAIERNRTMEAGKIALLLASQYSGEKNTTKVFEIFSGFLNMLDTLVRSDSTLIESKVFQLQESRIAQLEKEKNLRDNLIRKQSILHYVLMAGILMIILFSAFVVRSLYSIKKKNKKIALQSLRKEMNPHFIFNSLNSVNQFIAENNELEANKYLTSYSRLMRNILENSNKDFVTLSIEIEQLKEYLDLEYLRFHDKFRYEIIISDKIDTDATLIPNMLIQPLLENAVWHGLRYKEKEGFLQLSIEIEKKEIKIIVNDNGIGIIQSNNLKTKHQKENHSLGISNTKERIKLLNDLYHINISMTIINKEDPETGVIVYLHVPLLDKSRVL